MGCISSVPKPIRIAAEPADEVTGMESSQHKAATEVDLRSPSASIGKARFPVLSININVSQAADATGRGASSPDALLHTPDATALSTEPLTPQDIRNRREAEFQEFIARERKFQEELMQLDKETAKLPLQRLPEEVQSIRMFLSSTFRDFNEERNLANTIAFPRIDKLCRERGVNFSPLDLRWGITSEQSGSGQVIKICLEEIDRCRPFFVGSLGFRNGWALSEQYRDELLEKTLDIGERAFPWVQEFRDRSVTELEMLHGALNNPGKALRSFFYFRDVRFLESLDPEQRKVFVDMGERAEQRLRDLKRRIIRSGFRVRFFSSARQMTELLERDLVECVNRDFPPEKVMTVWQREVSDHSSFMDARTRVYVGSERYYEHLNSLLRGASSTPLLVTGAAGCGKSALLANWVRRLQKGMNQGAMPVKGLLDWNRGLIVYRFVGATPASSTALPLLRLIMEEINARYPDPMRELPSEPKRIIDDFPDWLAYGSEKAPLLIVIDSLTSMAEGDGALSWLPVSVPQSCRLVVSAVSDTPVERICKERGWRELVVNELSDEECAQLIHQYLGSYGKQLDAEQEGLVIASRHTRNPLYLVTFLQEVRVFGVYEKVSERIRHYMEAQTVTDLFTKVLEKLEQDFEEAAPGIVARVLGYLQASRHGMSELEIRGALELNLGLGEGNATPFPVLDFTSLMLRLDADLIDQRGLRDFSHEYLRRAVQDRYLRDAAALTVHRELARFWWSRPLSSRKAEELPYHLHILCTAAPVARSPRFRQSGDSEMLKDLVHSLRARSTSPSPSPMRAPSAGRAPSLSSSVAVAAAAVTVAATDDDTADRKGGGKTPSPSSPPSSPPGRARPQSALKMTPCAGKPLLGDSSTGASDEESLSDPGRALLRTLTDISLFRLLMTPQGKLDLHRYWLVLEKRGLVPNVASAYMAPVQEFAKAAPHAGEFAAVCEQLATFLIDTDRYLGANLFLQQALSILVKQHGENHPTVENIVAKEADLAFRQGRYAEALPLYRKALAIASALQGADSLRASVLETNIAGILKEQGDFETALAMYRRSMQKKVALAGPRDPVVAVSMTNLGDLFMRMGQADKALPLYENALQILEAARGSHHPQVAVVLSSLAAAHLKLERTAEALTLFERARTIKEEALGPDHVGMAVVLNNLAGAYHSQGDAERALRLYERAVKILERYHGVESPVLVPTLTNMGMVYETQRDYEMALSLYGRALRLAEAANGPEHLDLALILSAMAAVFMHQEEFQQAAQVYSRQVAILKKHLGAADPRVAACLDSLGAAFQSTQDFDHAAEAHAEQKMSLKMALEAACARGDSESTQEELRQSLAGACVTLGAVLLTLGRHAAARENFSEALAIREQLLGKEHEKTLEARGWLEDCGEEDEVESEAESALGDRAVGLDAGQAGSAAENCE